MFERPREEREDPRRVRACVEALRGVPLEVIERVDRAYVVGERRPLGVNLHVGEAG